MASFSMNRNSVKIHGTGIAKATRLLVVSDAHLSEDDERGLPNQENSKRMAAAYPQGLANFTQMLSERKTDAYDYLLMLGDMVSFPTAKGVETVMDLAGKTGLPYAYTAGNHDWHFEGLPGTEIALRREWEAKRLAPLYKGRNPLCYSIELNGLNLVMMDTSACEILPEQQSYSAIFRSGCPDVTSVSASAIRIGTPRRTAIGKSNNAFAGRKAATARRRWISTRRFSARKICWGSWRATSMGRASISIVENSSWSCSPPRPVALWK